MEALVRKPGTRILNDLERRAFEADERDYRRVLGGLLVQDRDTGAGIAREMTVVCGSVDESVWADLIFAWPVVRHVRRTRS